LKKLVFMYVSFLLLSIYVVSAQPASWPNDADWIGFGTDINNNGAIDNWRDIANVSQYCDGTYLFLRETMYGEPALPGNDCSPGENVCTEVVRYKYFLNLLPSDGETYGDFLIFAEDRTDPVSGQYELYFVYDADNDDDFKDDMDMNAAGTQKYNSSSANFVTESPGLVDSDFGYRLLGTPDNSVDFYLRLGALNLSSCNQVELLAATDQDAANPIDQQPTTDIAPENFTTPTYCGDNIVNGAEECDDGGSNGILCNPPYSGSCTYCSLNCTNVTLTGGFCGDNIVNGAEQCEGSQTQACTIGGYAGIETCNASSCTWGSCVATEYCGDGIINDAEECDNYLLNGILCSPPYGGSCIYCSLNCTNVTLTGGFCGNNITEAGEECDDGNLLNDDGCSSVCLNEVCGDNITQANEECDDGNLVDNDGCSSLCLNELCGDNITQPPEECDDGNLNNTDSCRNNCLLPFCGDAIVDPVEECDDGNNVDEDGCNAGCIIEFCGDNILQIGLGEECDDGNNIDGDGCQADCTFCDDDDNDGCCNEVDACPGSRPGEPINQECCDPFQFCATFNCGLGCEQADFVPFGGIPENTTSPYDCTTVVVYNQGSYNPRCFPLTCLD
jgi:cysteine-rich repeat protein